MIGVIVCLAAICALLFFLLVMQDEQNVALASENGLLRGRMESLDNARAEDPMQDSTMNQSLTKDDIVEAVRNAGYAPEQDENWIHFMVNEDTVVIDASVRPWSSIFKTYKLDPAKIDITILKHASHLLSDDMHLVKAAINEKEDVAILSIFLEMVDCNPASLNQNMIQYVKILNEASSHLDDIYQRLIKESCSSAILSGVIMAPDGGHRPLS